MLESHQGQGTAGCLYAFLNAFLTFEYMHLFTGGLPSPPGFALEQTLMWRKPFLLH